jgi:thymidylate kinase
MSTITPPRPTVAPARLSIGQSVARALESADPVAILDRVDPEALVDWCTRNKFPLMALGDAIPLRFHDCPAFAQAIAEEHAWYGTQRAEYVLARNAWESRGIPCLMIKSAGNHPAFPHTSDNIDILVRRDHGLAARDTLRGMGYVEIRNVEEPQKFLFRKFHDGRCVSAIHVHEQIAWFVGFLDDALVRERMRPAQDDPLVTIPSPEDAILINLAHACYENKVLRFNDVVRVRHALREAGESLDWRYMDSIATARGWRDGLAFMLLVYACAEAALFGSALVPPAQIARLESLIEDDAPVWQRLTEIRMAGIRDLPMDLSYRFCKRLYYRKILADPARSSAERRRDAFVTLVWGVRLKSRLRPQRGFVVSISGVDGSGKTAHAETLVNTLRLCEIRTTYVWSRGGSTGLPGLVSAIRNSVKPSRARGPQTTDAIARRREKLSRPAAGFAWAWTVALDQIATTYLRVWLPAWRGRVVVADRWVYDTAVEMDVSLPERARWSRLAMTALLRAVPRSHLGIVLDVTPETARARKPEEDWHAGFEEERQRYRALANEHALQVISTEGPFAASNDILLQRAIMRFMGRNETRLNALMLYNPRQKNVPDPIWAEGGPG